MVEVTNSRDSLCNMRILVMRHLNNITGMSYGLINILLFVVLGPLSTLIFTASLIIAKIKGKYSKQFSVALDIVGVIIVLSVLIPIFYAFMTMPISSTKLCVFHSPIWINATLF